MAIVDDKLRLQAALEDIAGAGAFDVSTCELEHDPTEWPRDRELPWFWSWSLGASTASGRAATPDKAIAAACRTLRASLGVPQPEVASVAAVREMLWRDGVHESYATERAEEVVARYGPLPAVPVLALPSRDAIAVEVSKARQQGSTLGEVVDGVLALVRDAQPEAVKRWAELTKADRDDVLSLLRNWHYKYNEPRCDIAADLLEACPPKGGEW